MIFDIKFKELGLHFSIFSIDDIRKSEMKSVQISRIAVRKGKQL